LSVIVVSVPFDSLGVLATVHKSSSTTIRLQNINYS
jgi:hypothetical protein